MAYGKSTNYHQITLKYKWLNGSWWKNVYKSCCIDDVIVVDVALRWRYPAVNVLLNTLILLDALWPTRWRRYTSCDLGEDVFSVWLLDAKLNDGFIVAWSCFGYCPIPFVVPALCVVIRALRHGDAVQIPHSLWYWTVAHPLTFEVVSVLDETGAMYRMRSSFLLQNEKHGADGNHRKIRESLDASQQLLDLLLVAIRNRKPTVLCSMTVVCLTEMKIA